MCMGSGGRRALKVIGEGGFWNTVGKVHTWVYRRTGGTIGHKAGALTHLLLTTTGRKSGMSRTVPLTYLADGDCFVLVASNGGSDRHPAWWLNLQKHPRARVQLKRRTIDVVAHRADADARARLWPTLTAVNPFYSRYEQITDRDIPVVVLVPVQEIGGSGDAHRCPDAQAGTRSGGVQHHGVPVRRLLPPAR